MKTRSTESKAQNLYTAKNQFLILRKKKLILRKFS